MKRILLLGGMTPDVTVLYYNAINRVVRSTLGARNSAAIYLYSANLEEMIQFAASGDWDSFARVYIDAIDSVQDKVDGVVVCAILAHKVSDHLVNALSSASASTPTIKAPKFLHIADFLAQHIKAIYPHIHTLGLLGPKITMQGADDEQFFIGRLQKPDNGFQVLVPEPGPEQDEVNRGMMEEVAKGASEVTAQTKAMFIRSAKSLIERGAQAIILGSTDLGFVVRQEDFGDDVVIIDPAAVHAEGVARWALQI
jgi:aspartate racemase